MICKGIGECRVITLTTGQDYADATSSIRNWGLLPSDFKFTSGNEAINGAAGTLDGADSLVDPSTSDNDVLTATVTALVAPTLQNIETINLTVNTAGAGLNFASVTGTKTVTLTGSANAQLNNIDATAAPTIVLKDYTKTATITAATLAGSKDALSLKVSGATATSTVIPGVTLNATAAGTLETFNLDSAGSTKNTVDLVQGGNLNALTKTVVTGAADLDLRLAHALINGQTLDASGHTGALNLIVDRNGAMTATTNLTNVTGVDVYTFRDSAAGGNDLVVTGLATGSTVVLANGWNAAPASLSVKGAASKTNDTLTVKLDHSTDATDIDVNGANDFSILDVETITLVSEGGTSAGNKIQQLVTSGGATVKIAGSTKLDLGLKSAVSAIEIAGSGKHKVAFQAATAYAEGKNLSVDASAATGEVAIDMSNFNGSGGGSNEKLTIIGSAQSDTITTCVTGGQTVDIDAGAGNDTITVVKAEATVSQTSVTTGSGSDTIKVDLTAIAFNAKIKVTDFTVGAGGDVFSTKGWVAAAFTLDKGGATLDNNDIYITANALNGVSEGTVGLDLGDGKKALVMAINSITGVAELYAVTGLTGANNDTYTLVASFDNITTVGVLNNLVAANFGVFS